MSARKVEKDISSSVKGNPIGRAVILVIIYFATLQTDVNDVIIHLSWNCVILSTNNGGQINVIVS
jgi:hypothetical protein